MSYQQAMQAAGADVKAFEQFGSYQGDWLAEVVYNGQRLLIKGSYGSCSGCDAFEGEFGYCDGHYHGDKYVYAGSSDVDTTGCEQCADYQKRLEDFGKSYLDAPSDPALVRKRFEEDSEWDMDAKDVLKWLDAHFPAEVN